MAGRSGEQGSRVARKRAKASRSRRRLRLVWLVGVVAISAYLYYRPLASYLETRNQLAAEQAEVEAVRTAKERLEQRLALSTSLDAMRREARRIGYVRPGEQLFIVKGVAEWRRSLRSVRSGG
ncbi:MAG: septum formation initiator family protein [Actinobacteria bacterium]|nr:septum formation initiator family protein [Actinomycetota bacterium]